MRLTGRSIVPGWGLRPGARRLSNKVLLRFAGLHLSTRMRTRIYRQIGSAIVLVRVMGLVLTGGKGEGVMLNVLTSSLQGRRGSARLLADLRTMPKQTRWLLRTLAGNWHVSPLLLLRGMGRRHVCGLLVYVLTLRRRGTGSELVVEVGECFLSTFPLGRLTIGGRGI